MRPVHIYLDSDKNKEIKELGNKVFVEFCRKRGFMKFLIHTKMMVGELLFFLYIFMIIVAHCLSKPESSHHLDI